MNIQDKLELTELIARYNNRSIKFSEYARLMTLLLAEHNDNLTLESKINDLQEQLDKIDCDNERSDYYMNREDLD